MEKRDFETHVTILGWFNVVASAVFICLGLCALLFFGGIGSASGDPKALRILSVVGCAGFSLFSVFAIPGLIGGYGLLKRRPWGRIGGIVTSILHLFNLPIGTIIGLYGLWVLSDNEAIEYFSASAAGVVAARDSEEE